MHTSLPMKRRVSMLSRMPMIAVAFCAGWLIRRGWLMVTGREFGNSYISETRRLMEQLIIIARFRWTPKVPPHLSVPNMFTRARCCSLGSGGW